MTRTLHWIPLEKEPSIENPWPKEGQRVLLWGRRNFPVVANYYATGWFIETRPIAPHHLNLNFSHWAAVPGPDGEETAPQEPPEFKVKVPTREQRVIAGNVPGGNPLSEPLQEVPGLPVWTPNDQDH